MSRTTAHDEPPGDPATALAARCRDVIGLMTPHLVGPPGGAAEATEPRRIGVAEADLHHVDPFCLAAAPFVDRIHRLREAACAARGAIAPRWALYECGLVPGLVVGLAALSSRLPPPARARLGVGPGSDELVPVSRVVASRCHIHNAKQAQEVSNQRRLSRHPTRKPRNAHISVPASPRTGARPAPDPALGACLRSCEARWPAAQIVRPHAEVGWSLVARTTVPDRS